MKWVLVAVLLGIVLVSCAGCGLSTADQARLNRLAEDMRKYEDIALKVRTKIDSGEMTAGEGKAVVADLQEDLKRIREEAEYIASRGYDTRDIILGLGQMLLTFFGVNIYRSRSHPLTTVLPLNPTS